jgi:PAS domain S-box-containing protein
MVESIVESSTETVLNMAKAEAIRVLHVDDDPSFLKVAKQCLEMQGAFEVDTVSSVNEALEKLEKTDYDAVVSDYQMPGKDSLEFLKELREKGNTVPFIVFTGKGREEIAMKALNLGADGYFNKSGDPETVYGELAHGMRQVVGRRRAEQSLLKSEDKYRRLVETLHEGIWVIDKDSRTTFVNPRMAEMLGYDTEEMKGRHLFSFMDERGVEIAERLLERRQQGIKEQHDFEFLRKDGTRIYATLETSPITDDNGNYSGALASVMDITERKRAEEALRESEERLRSIFENSSDQIFMLDRDCRFLSINKTAADLSGMSPKEMIGMPISELFPETIAAKFSRNIKNVFDTGKSLFIDEKMVIKGRELYNSTSLNPVRDDNGRVTAVTGIVRDITERKRMEEEIKALARFPSENPNPVLRISQDCRILFANNAGKALLKKLDCEVGGSVPTFLKSLTVETMKSKSHRDEESEIGGRIYGFYAMPIVDKGYVNVYGIDITERKKAEETLLASEAKWQSITENSPDHIILLDRDAKILYINHTVPDLTTEKVLGKSKYDLVPSEFRKVAADCNKNVLETGKPSSYITEYHTKEGEIRHFDVRVAPVFQSGKVVGLISNSTDITQRKKAEEQIRDSEEQLSQLFMRMPSGVAVYKAVNNGEDFVFTDFNEAAERIEHISRREIVGKCVTEVFPGVKDFGVFEVFQRVWRTGQFEYFPAALYKDDKDQGTWRESWIYKLPNGSIVAIYNDITQRKKAEEKLKEHGERIEMMNEKLRVVGSFTKHDVRNKLSAVTGYAYLLKKKHADQADIVDGLGKMEQAVKDVGKIFDFARMYEQLGVEELAYVDVEKTLDEAVALFSGLTIKVVNDCHGLTVLADSFLRQLFYNFIDNTRKYGGKATAVRVYYEKAESGGLRLVYEDDGVGISTENRLKLFTEGFSTGGSTGFGLFLIRKMMDVYGWTIQETGKQGTGAKFTMSIPRTGSTGKPQLSTIRPKTYSTFKNCSDTETSETRSST